MSTVTASQIVRRAMELIDTPDKWCQGVDSPSLCALNALCYASEDLAGTSWMFAPFEIARKAMVRRTAPSTIPDWNDAPERTHAEVLAALKAVAELLESNESH